MMNKEEILNRLHDNSILNINASDTSVDVTVNKDVCVVLTIPYDVNEMFFEATDHATGNKVKDWFDYYDDEAESDFAEDLERFIDAMSNCPIRINENSKRVEYKKEDWEYFFGEI